MIKTKDKIQMFSVMIVAVLFMAGAIYFFAGEEPRIDPDDGLKIGADLIDEKCPPCPSCKITAERIISDNPDIDLTKYNTATKFKIPDIEGLEVQIGEDIITKSQLDALRVK